MLKEVAKRLTSSTRQADTVSRIGGDEFISICAKIEAAEDAVVVAKKIIAILSEPFHVGGHECTIGASIGISVHPEDGDDAEILLKKADMAMYRVKEGRKNGYLLYRDIKNNP